MPTQPASRPDHHQSTDRNGRPGRHAPRRMNASLHVVSDGQRLRAEIRQSTTVGTIGSHRLALLARRTNGAREGEREQEQPYEYAILQRILERIRNPDLIELDQEELERGRQRYRRDRQRIVGDANSLRRRQGWLVPHTQAGNERASPSANETAGRAASGTEAVEGASESFSDLERGQQRRGQPDQVALSSQGGEDKRFTSLADRIALQIFRITSNVKGIESLVKQLGGRNDNPELRSKLSNLTEATKDLVKSSTEDVKALANYDLPAHDAQTQQRKFRQARISRDFQTAILSYQNAAKLSAEKQRRYVDRAKAALDQGDDHEAREALSPGSDSRSQQQQQLQSVQTELVPDSELEYQEQLIQEREGEIEDIERGVLELNEIFRDLGTIVTEQQSMLDNIESNVISVANDTQGASEELISAHNYQKKAGRRMLYLLLIFIVVITIVLLAVLS